MEAIRAAGGEIFAITSDPQSLASEAEENWGIEFQAIGDPHHEIRDACQQRGFVNVFFNPDFGHLGSRPWASHLKGYFQPAVVAISNKNQVLYRWRCQPNHRNMSGAGQLPTPEYVWSEIQKNSEGSTDAQLDQSPEFAREDVSWLRYVSLFLAHGWFLRPKAFPLARKGDKRSARPSRMNRRIGFFVLGWIMLFSFVPFQWAIAGFALWCGVAWRGIATMNRQQQNITSGEPPATS